MMFCCLLGTITSLFIPHIQLEFSLQVFLWNFVQIAGLFFNPNMPSQAFKKTILLASPKCGYEKEETIPKNLGNSKTVKQNTRQLVDAISVEELKLSTLSTANVACPSCGNHKAYTWQVQALGAEETATQFFRCTKCGSTFRDYT